MRKNNQLSVGKTRSLNRDHQLRRNNSLTDKQAMRAALSGNQVEAKNVKLGNEIGAGSFGRVYLGRDGMTGRLVAVKETLIPEPDEESFGDPNSADFKSKKPLVLADSWLKQWNPKFRHLRLKDDPAYVNASGSDGGWGSVYYGKNTKKQNFELRLLQTRSDVTIGDLGSMSPTHGFIQGLISRDSLSPETPVSPASQIQASPGSGANVDGDLLSLDDIEQQENDPESRFFRGFDTQEQLDAYVASELNEEDKEMYRKLMRERDRVMEQVEEERKKKEALDKARVEELNNLLEELALLKSLVHHRIVAYLGARYQNAKELENARHPLNAMTDDSSANRPSVVSSQERFGKLSIYMEYLSGGSIKSQLDEFGPLGETVIRSYCGQILEGLCYLHSHKVVHLDLKPGNILLEIDGSVKIADFGCSTKMNFSRSGSAGTAATGGLAALTAGSSDGLAASASGPTRIVGTPSIWAPEQLQASGDIKSTSPACDIWAFSCCLIEMRVAMHLWKLMKIDNVMLGYVQLCIQPWDASTVKKNVIKKLEDAIVENDEAEFANTGLAAGPDILSDYGDGVESSGRLSHEFKSVLLKCLNKDPAKRPTAKQLLAHPFCNTGGAAGAAGLAPGGSLSRMLTDSSSKDTLGAPRDGSARGRMRRVGSTLMTGMKTVTHTAADAAGTLVSLTPLTSNEPVMVVDTKTSGAAVISVTPSGSDTSGRVGWRKTISNRFFGAFGSRRSESKLSVDGNRTTTDANRLTAPGPLQSGEVPKNEVRNRTLESGLSGEFTDGDITSNEQQMLSRQTSLRTDEISELPHSNTMQSRAPPKSAKSMVNFALDNDTILLPEDRDEKRNRRGGFRTNRTKSFLLTRQDSAGSAISHRSDTDSKKVNALGVPEVAPTAGLGDTGDPDLEARFRRGLPSRFLMKPRILPLLFIGPDPKPACLVEDSLGSICRRRVKNRASQLRTSIQRVSEKSGARISALAGAAVPGPNSSGGPTPRASAAKFDPTELEPILSVSEESAAGADAAPRTSTVSVTAKNSTDHPKPSFTATELVIPDENFEERKEEFARQYDHMRRKHAGIGEVSTRLRHFLWARFLRGLEIFACFDHLTELEFMHFNFNSIRKHSSAYIVLMWVLYLSGMMANFILVDLPWELELFYWYNFGCICTSFTIYLKLMLPLRLKVRRTSFFLYPFKIFPFYRDLFRTLQHHGAHEGSGANQRSDNYTKAIQGGFAGKLEEPSAKPFDSLSRTKTFEIGAGLAFSSGSTSADAKTVPPEVFGDIAFSLISLQFILHMSLTYEAVSNIFLLDSETTGTGTPKVVTVESEAGARQLGESLGVVESFGIDETESSPMLTLANLRHLRDLSFYSLGIVPTFVNGLPSHLHKSFRGKNQSFIGRLVRKLTDSTSSKTKADNTKAALQYQKTEVPNTGVPAIAMVLASLFLPVHPLSFLVMVILGCGGFFLLNLIFGMAAPGQRAKSPFDSLKDGTGDSNIMGLSAIDLSYLTVQMFAIGVACCGGLNVRDMHQRRRFAERRVTLEMVHRLNRLKAGKLRAEKMQKDIKAIRSNVNVLDHVSEWRSKVSEVDVQLADLLNLMSVLHLHPPWRRVLASTISQLQELKRQMAEKAWGVGCLEVSYDDLEVRMRVLEKRHIMGLLNVKSSSKAIGYELDGADENENSLQMLSWSEKPEDIVAPAPAKSTVTKSDEKKPSLGGVLKQSSTKFGAEENGGNAHETGPVPARKESTKKISFAATDEGKHDGSAFPTVQTVMRPRSPSNLVPISERGESSREESLQLSLQSGQLAALGSAQSNMTVTSPPRSATVGTVGTIPRLSNESEFPTSLQPSVSVPYPGEIRGMQKPESMPSMKSRSPEASATGSGPGSNQAAFMTLSSTQHVPDSRESVGTIPDVGLHHGLGSNLEGSHSMAPASGSKQSAASAEYVDVGQIALDTDQVELQMASDTEIGVDSAAWSSASEGDLRTRELPVGPSGEIIPKLKSEYLTNSTLGEIRESAAEKNPSIKVSTTQGKTTTLVISTESASDSHESLVDSADEISYHGPGPDSTGGGAASKASAMRTGSPVAVNLGIPSPESAQIPSVSPFEAAARAYQKRQSEKVEGRQSSWADRDSSTRATVVSVETPAIPVPKATGPVSMAMPKPALKQQLSKSLGGTVSSKGKKISNEDTGTRDFTLTINTSSGSEDDGQKNANQDPPDSPRRPDGPPSPSQIQRIIADSKVLQVENKLNLCRIFDPEPRGIMRGSIMYERGYTHWLLNMQQEQLSQAQSAEKAGLGGLGPATGLAAKLLKPDFWTDAAQGLVFIHSTSSGKHVALSEKDKERFSDCDLVLSYERRDRLKQIDKLSLKLRGLFCVQSGDRSYTNEHFIAGQPGNLDRFQLANFPNQHQFAYDSLLFLLEEDRLASDPSASRSTEAYSNAAGRSSGTSAPASPLHRTASGGGFLRGLFQRSPTGGTSTSNLAADPGPENSSSIKAIPTAPSKLLGLSNAAFQNETQSGWRGEVNLTVQTWASPDAAASIAFGASATASGVTGSFAMGIGTQPEPSPNNRASLAAGNQHCATAPTVKLTMDLTVSMLHTSGMLHLLLPSAANATAALPLSPTNWQKNKTSNHPFNASHGHHPPNLMSNISVVSTKSRGGGTRAGMAMDMSSAVSQFGAGTGDMPASDISMAPGPSPTQAAASSKAVVSLITENSEVAALLGYWNLLGSIDFSLEPIVYTSLLQTGVTLKTSSPAVLQTMVKSMFCHFGQRISHCFLGDTRPFLGSFWMDLANTLFSGPTNAIYLMADGEIFGGSMLFGGSLAGTTPGSTLGASWNSYFTSALGLEEELLPGLPAPFGNDNKSPNATVHHARSSLNVPSGASTASAIPGPKNFHHSSTWAMADSAGGSPGASDAFSPRAGRSKYSVAPEEKNVHQTAGSMLHSQALQNCDSTAKLIYLLTQAGIWQKISELGRVSLVISSMCYGVVSVPGLMRFLTEKWVLKVEPRPSKQKKGQDRVSQGTIESNPFIGMNLMYQPYLPPQPMSNQRQHGNINLQSSPTPIDSRLTIDVPLFDSTFSTTSKPGDPNMMSAISTTSNVAHTTMSSNQAGNVPPLFYKEEFNFLRQMIQDLMNNSRDRDYYWYYASVEQKLRDEAYDAYQREGDTWSFVKQSFHLTRSLFWCFSPDFALQDRYARAFYTSNRLTEFSGRGILPKKFDFDLVLHQAEVNFSTIASQYAESEDFKNRVAALGGSLASPNDSTATNAASYTSTSSQHVLNSAKNALEKNLKRTLKSLNYCSEMIALFEYVIIPTLEQLNDGVEATRRDLPGTTTNKGQGNMSMLAGLSAAGRGGSPEMLSPFLRSSGLDFLRIAKRNLRIWKIILRKRTQYCVFDVDALESGEKASMLNSLDRDPHDLLDSIGIPEVAPAVLYTRGDYITLDELADEEEMDEETEESDF